MQETGTLILTRRDVARAMALGECIEAVEAAFAGLAAGTLIQPQVVHIPAADGAFHVKSAAFSGTPHYLAVKVNGNFPANPRANGLPTIQGAILLSDTRNGALLAVIDSTEITALRTGAATAVAARYLAPPDADAMTVIGCGIQGRIQLLSLLEVLPLQTIYAFDTDAAQSKRFAITMRTETGRQVVPVAELVDGTRKSRIIVTCTTSRRAFLGREQVIPGSFIAAVGADNADKQELEPELLGEAKVFVDAIEQCAGIGELHHALKAGTMTAADVIAELGSVVAGGRRPEFAADDIVVFDSTGSAIQDVAAAGLVYERARSAGIGSSVSFC